MRAPIHPLSSLLLLFPLLFACSKDDCGDCDASGITANITLTKTTTTCADLDLLWDISFGVGLQFDIDIQCGDFCEGNRVTYQQRQLVRNGDNVKYDDQAFMMTGFNPCDDIRRPTLALNNRADGTSPFEYELGDTIFFEFTNPQLCIGGADAQCDDEISLDLPEFNFMYVPVPEDFDCQ